MLANTAYSTARIMVKDSARMSKATKKGFKYLSGKRKTRQKCRSAAEWGRGNRTWKSLRY